MSGLQGVAFALANILLADPGAQPIDVEARRAMARRRLDEWRADTGRLSRWNIDRSIIIDRLRVLVENPELLNQGVLDSCGVAATLYLALKWSPHEMVYGFRRIYEQGNGLLGGCEVTAGDAVRAFTEEQIQADDESVREVRTARGAYPIQALHPADWFFQVVAISGFKPKDTMTTLAGVRSGGALRGMGNQNTYIAPMTECFAGCRDIRHGTILNEFDKMVTEHLVGETPSVQKILWFDTNFFTGRVEGSGGDKHIVALMKAVIETAGELEFQLHSYGKAESIRKSKAIVKDTLARIFLVTVK